MATLYYVHDPMCSWCYAFRPVLTQLLESLPEHIKVIRLLGGLAGDCDEPMPEETRKMIMANWKRIEQTVPDTTFNYDFWTDCKPRRSTYPACRAVIAARKQGDKFDIVMTHAIQDAYYLQARNPSDISTLLELAYELDLSNDRFTNDLKSMETEEELTQEIKQSRRLGLNSFPSLLLEDKGSYKSIQIDYHQFENMLIQIAA